jgi:hypothetical protein
MNQQIWKPVVGYEGLYEVSDQGRVRSIEHQTKLGPRGGRVLSRATEKRLGYVKVNLYRDGKARSVRVHCLVLEAFRGSCPEGMEGCHDNGNRSDNRLDNLRWDTRPANHADKHRHGTMMSGERHYASKLDEGAVRRAFRLRDGGISVADIATDLGVSAATVHDAFRGKTWKHLGLSA